MRSWTTSSDGACRIVLIGWTSCSPPGFECCERELPFMRLDADKVVLFTLLQERDALAHQRVGDDHAGLGFRVRLGSIEGSHDSIQIIAVDALHEPTEGLELVDQRLES